MYWKSIEFEAFSILLKKSGCEVIDKMDKLKRFIDCYISTETCNLRCHYCYIAQHNKFNNKLVDFQHSPEEIATALSQERLGGPCLLNFCAGGETLLSPEVLPVVRALLQEGHYVMIVTNGTVDKRFDELNTIPRELCNHLFFKFSFHYLELKRLGWFDKFKNNVEKAKKAGCSFTIEVTPSDELIPYIQEMKNCCRELFGADCHVTIARNDVEYNIGHLSKLSFEEYKKTWKVFDSELFDFKSDIFYRKRKEFCYAGEYTLVCNLSSGELKQCYCGKTLCNIYDSGDISFRAIGHGCGYAHCYNGHVFLTMGVIPELVTPSYDQLRNRVTDKGEEWLTEEMKSFMNQRADMNNPRYSTIEKLNCDLHSADLILKAAVKSIIKKKELKNK